MPVSQALHIAAKIRFYQFNRCLGQVMLDLKFAAVARQGFTLTFQFFDLWSRKHCSCVPSWQEPPSQGAGVFQTIQRRPATSDRFCQWHVSRFDAAPLIAFIAAEEMNFRNETNGRNSVLMRCGSR